MANSSLLIATPNVIAPSPRIDEMAGRVIEKVLGSAGLPPPPGVAMRVVQATADPDCTTAAIVEILKHEPTLCAAVLKAINSCVYGLPSPVATLDRAVLLLGMRTVRSMVLTLALPAMRFPTVPDAEFRRHWLSSVSGAIIARELCLRLGLRHAEEDLVCGLLRDIGGLALRQVFPFESERYRTGIATRPFSTHMSFEKSVYGVDHAVMSAEMLRQWRLPESICEPVRHHHHPDAMKAGEPDMIARAHRLWFVEALVNVDIVTQSPTELDALLVAAEKYDMSIADVIAFLQSVVPKVEAFTSLLSIEVGRCPDFAATLAHGREALVNLSHTGDTPAVPAAR